MTHHLAHAEEHEPHHQHFICPECHGQGWVEQEPRREREADALRRYEEGLKRELKAVQERVDKLGA